MAAEEKDPFAVSHGSTITPYTARVVSSVFNINEDYNAEALLLEWELEMLDDDAPFETRRWSATCGKKFETQDGGKTAVHTSGKYHPFHAKSRMGMLVHRAFHDPDSNEPAPIHGGEGSGGEEIEPFGLRPYFVEHGWTPTDAEAWVGMVFEFDTEYPNYGDDIEAKPIEMPVRLISTPDEKTSKADSSKKGAAKKKGGTRKAKAKSEPELDVEGIKAAVLEAGEADDIEEFGQFTAAAADVLEAHDVPEDHELWEWVNDEDNGAWSEFDWDDEEGDED